MQKFSSVGKQALNIAVTTATILWSAGFASIMPAAAASLTAGDLVKGSGPAVYYYTADGKRAPFPNAKVFTSWYGSDYSKVKTITDSELAALSLSGTNMTYRPGTRLVKITTDPKVYAVEPGGSLRWVNSEAVAMALLGSNWNKQIDDVADVFFTNYSKGADLSTATPSVGSVVKTADSDTMYYIDATGKRPISASALAANGLQTMYVRTVASSVLSGLASGAAVSGSETAIAQPMLGSNNNNNPTTPVVAGSLMVAMDAQNPAATTHASGTAYNPALALNLSASSAGPVTLTSLTVTRGGLAVDSNISGLAAFADGMRLTNFVTFADGKVTLNFLSPLTVPAGSSKALWLKTNVSGTSGTYSLSIAKATDFGTTSTVSGTLPLTGATFSMTSGANVVGALTADAVLVHNNGANDATAVNINLGTVGQEVGRFRFVAGANEDIKLSGLSLYNNGNSSDGDVTNISLVGPDGKVLAKLDKTANRAANFDLSASPYMIPKGTTRDLSLRLDVVSGSTRTSRFVIQNDYDIQAMGSQTSSGILATAAAAVDTAFPLGDSTGGASCSAGVTCINKITTNSGSLLFSKSGDSTSGNVSAGANSVVLGKYMATAQGEDMELRTMVFAVTYTTALTGTLKLKVGDSTVYTLAGASVAATGANNTAALSSYPVLKAGVPTPITVLGDISSSATTGSSYLVSLDITQAKRLSTNDLVDPSVTQTAANTLTVAAASLQVAKNSSYPDTTIVAGLSPAKVGSFNFVAGSTEDINVSSLTVALNGTITNASSLVLKTGDTPLASQISSPSATNAISISGFVVPKGGSKTVDVYVNSNSSTTGPTSVDITAASGTGANSGASVTGTGTTASGQTVTWAASGTLTLAVDTTNTPTNQLAHSNQTDVPLLAVRLTTNNAEDIRITSLQVSATNGTTNWKDLKLFDGTTPVGAATQLVNGVALFGGLSYTIKKDSTQTLWLKGSTNSSGTLNSQAVTQFALDYVEAIGASGGTTIKPGTTLSTTWSATATAVAAANISVSSAAGFHLGDVIFAYDGTAGGNLGLVTAEPTSTTLLNVATRAIIAFNGSATISKIASGATTAASAGTAVKAGAALTVTSSKGFSVGDAVIVADSAGVQIGYVSALTSTTLTVRTTTDMAGTASLVSKLGTDTLSTAASSASTLSATAVTAQAVTSTTGFNVGDMVLVQDTVNNGSFGMVSAIGSSTSMSLLMNAAVTTTTNSVIVRVGAANPTTALVTTSATAAARTIGGTAMTATPTGYGVGDVVLTAGTAATAASAVLGKASAVGSTTVTVASAVADAAAVAARITRLPGAAASGNFVGIQDVEPTITASTTTGGNSAGGSGQTVGVFNVKADGDRNLNITSLNVQAGGSNLPWNYVTSYELFNGSTRLAAATPQNFATGGASAGANVLTGTSLFLCWDDTDNTGTTNAGVIFMGVAAGNNTRAVFQQKLAVGDTIVVFRDSTNYITATVTAIATTATGAGNCNDSTTTNDLTLTVTNSSATGTTLGTTAASIKSFNVIFDSNSATPLATQTVTAGSELALTVKADTTSVKNTVTTGNVNYNVKIANTETFTGTKLSGGLTWGYTPSGGSAIASLTTSDSYPVIAPTLVY